MIYKTLKKVSNVCQVLDKRTFPATTTIAGVTFTNNSDGTITANGTATYTINIIILEGFPIKKNHKYLILDATGSTSRKNYSTWLKSKIGAIVCDSADNPIGNLTYNDDKGIVYVRVENGITVSNLIFKPQLFDLTEMYGAGHEPTTVEQFRQDFPEEMYDYSSRCFITSYKNCLKVSNVCQLLDKSKYISTTTDNGITFTNNGDGTITVNGTASSLAQYNLYGTLTFDLSVVKNHKYLFILTDITPNFYFVFGGAASGLGYYEVRNKYIFVTPSDTRDGKCYAIIRIEKGKTCNNEIAKPQLFDLTEMYGAGHEPTTVEQFRQDFPDEMYDYKPYSTIPSYKKSLICTTKNLFDINSVSNINNWVTSVSSAHPYGYYTFYLNPNTTYTFSRKYASNNDSVFACFSKNYGVADGDGFFIHPTSSSLVKDKLSFTTDDTGIMYLNVYGIRSVMSSFIELIEDAQLEECSTATEYHPYGYL